MPSPNTIVASGTNVLVDATGLPMQSHLLYASNTGRWWLLWQDTTQRFIIRTRVSSGPDLSTATWADGASSPSMTSSGPYNNGSGRDLAVAYKSIAGVDVVHVSLDRDIGGVRQRTWARATITGATTLVWGTWTDTAEPNNNSYFPYGSSMAFSSDNHVFVGDDIFNGNGNTWAASSLNADLGASWTAGFNTAVQLWIANEVIHGTALFDVGSTNVLLIGGDGATPTTDSQCVWERSSGTTWAATAATPFGAAGNNQDFADWGACARSQSDVHFVRRTGATTFEHWRFNGTSWVAGSTLPVGGITGTLVGAGIYLVSDGTNVWCFAVDSSAGNPIRYIRWTGSGWDPAWSTITSNANVKRGLAGAPSIAQNQINIAWVEGTSGGPYSIVGATLPVSAGVPAALAAIATLTATALAATTFPPISDIATGSWSTETGATTNLFQSIDEAIPVDADYVQSSSQPVGDTFIEQFQSLAPQPGNMLLHIRYGKDVTGDTDDLLIEFMQGNTVLQTWALYDVPTGVSQFDANITTPITDWTTLRTRLTARIMASTSQATASLAAGAAVGQPVGLSAVATLTSTRAQEIVLEPLVL